MRSFKISVLVIMVLFLTVGVSYAQSAKGALAEGHFVKGVKYRGEWKYDEAIEEFKKTIAILPDHVNAHLSLAAIYMDKEFNFGEEGMVEEGIKELKKVIAIVPDHASTHSKLCTAYYNTKKYKLAIRHCDKSNRLGYKGNAGLMQLLEPYRKKLLLKRKKRQKKDKGIENDIISPLWGEK
jgi:tetratricopeptide (TPR) repeat protein